MNQQMVTAWFVKRTLWQSHQCFGLQVPFLIKRVEFALPDVVVLSTGTSLALRHGPKTLPWLYGIVVPAHRPRGPEYIYGSP